MRLPLTDSTIAALRLARSELTSSDCVDTTSLLVGCWRLIAEDLAQVSVRTSFSPFEPTFLTGERGDWGEPTLADFGPLGTILVTDAVSQTIQQASGLARRLGHDYVDLPHVLLALALGIDTNAAALLRRLSPDTDWTDELCVSLLNQDSDGLSRSTWRRSGPPGPRRSPRHSPRCSDRSDAADRPPQAEIEREKQPTFPDAAVARWLVEASRQYHKLQSGVRVALALAVALCIWLAIPQGSHQPLFWIGQVSAVLGVFFRKWVWFAVGLVLTAAIGTGDEVGALFWPCIGAYVAERASRRDGIAMTNGHWRSAVPRRTAIRHPSAFMAVRRRGRDRYWRPPESAIPPHLADPSAGETGASTLLLVSDLEDHVAKGEPPCRQCRKSAWRAAWRSSAPWGPGAISYLIEMGNLGRQGNDVIDLGQVDPAVVPDAAMSLRHLRFTEADSIGQLDERFDRPHVSAPVLMDQLMLTMRIVAADPSAAPYDEAWDELDHTLRRDVLFVRRDVDSLPSLGGVGPHAFAVSMLKRLQRFRTMQNLPPPSPKDPADVVPEQVASQFESDDERHVLPAEPGVAALLLGGLDVAWMLGSSTVTTGHVLAGYALRNFRYLSKVWPMWFWRADGFLRAAGREIEEPASRVIDPTGSAFLPSRELMDSGDVATNGQELLYVMLSRPTAASRMLRRLRINPEHFRSAVVPDAQLAETTPTESLQTVVSDLDSCTNPARVPGFTRLSFVLAATT